MTSDSSFLGTGWSFPPTFDLGARADLGTYPTALVSAEEDIEQSLRILLSTAPGERVMHPTFGCGLNRMVFEHVTESTITAIKDLIRRAILFFEPRITLDDIDVDRTDLFKGELRLRLAYTIKPTNTRGNLVYPLYLQEGTDAGASEFPA